MGQLQENRINKFCVFYSINEDLIWYLVTFLSLKDAVKLSLVSKYFNKLLILNPVFSRFEFVHCELSKLEHLESQFRYEVIIGALGILTSFAVQVYTMSISDEKPDHRQVESLCIITAFSTTSAILSLMGITKSSRLDKLGQTISLLKEINTFFNGDLNLFTNAEGQPLGSPEKLIKNAAIKLRAEQTPARYNLFLKPADENNQEQQDQEAHNIPNNSAISS